MTEKKISDIKQNEVLELLEKNFTVDSSWDSKWRDSARTWYSYYYGDQWTGEEIQQLTERNQAVTTFNYIRPSIDSLIGSERQNRPKITMAPRTLDDQQVAQAKTSLYNYITYNSKTDDEVDKMIKDAYIAGRGWMFLFPELNDKGEFKDLMHMNIDYRDVFIDPLSKLDDLSDCRRLHHAVYTDSDVIKNMFPKFEETTDTQNELFSGSSDEDIWYEDGDRTRPRLIHSWYRDEEGIVNQCIWVKGQVLFFEKNPYKNIDFPYVQYCVDRDLNNLPFGFVKGMISPQDEVNKRHSKALHYLNAKQIAAEENAFVDWEEAKKAAAKPDGVLKLRDGAIAENRFQIIDNTPLANAHLEMLNIAKNEIFASAGINAAFLGQGSQYESAKKTQVSIMSTQTSLVPVLNKLRIARHRLAELTMTLVPDFYFEERVFRIINEQGKYEFMPTNTKVLLDDNTLKTFNDLTAHDVDIVIEDAPAGLNEREEQFNQLMQLQGQTSRPIPMDVLLRYSNIKDKHKLADDISQAQQIESQMQQMQEYIAQLEKQIGQLGGVISQKDNQIVQIKTAAAVDKEVSKIKQAFK